MPGPARLRWVGSAVLVVLGLGVLVAVILWSPDHRDLAARACVILLGVIVLRLLTRAVVVTTLAPEDGSFDVALQGQAVRTLPAARDPGLIEEGLRSSMNRELELYSRVRPWLREIAADRLWANHGVLLDQQTESARRLLGDEGWELLRSDREPPVDRFGPGMPLNSLARIVTAVERL
jgi:hypothetical protein